LLCSNAAKTPNPLKLAGVPVKFIKFKAIIKFKKFERQNHGQNYAIFYELKQT